MGYVLTRANSSHTSAHTLTGQSALTGSQTEQVASDAELYSDPIRSLLERSLIWAYTSNTTCPLGKGQPQPNPEEEFLMLIQKGRKSAKIKSTDSSMQAAYILQGLGHDLSTAQTERLRRDLVNAINLQVKAYNEAQQSLQDVTGLQWTLSLTVSKGGVVSASLEPHCGLGPHRSAEVYEMINAFIEGRIGRSSGKRREAA